MIFSFSLVLVLLYSICYSVVNTLVVKKISHHFTITTNLDILSLITHREKVFDISGNVVSDIASKSLSEQLSTDTSNTHQSIGAGRISTIEEGIEFVAAVDGDHFSVLFLSLVLLCFHYTVFIDTFKRNLWNF
jgi:hypothetical protein